MLAAADGDEAIALIIKFHTCLLCAAAHGSDLGGRGIVNFNFFLEENVLPQKFASAHDRCPLKWSSVDKK